MFDPTDTVPESSREVRTAEDFQNLLGDALESLGEVVDEIHSGSESLAILGTKARVSSYRAEGMLTSDAGLVVRINGQEFRMTIQQAR